MKENSPANEYIDRVRQSLKVGGRLGKRILSEFEDHLREAVADELEKGVSRPQAEWRAIERMGSPTELAAKFGWIPPLHIRIYFYAFGLRLPEEWRPWAEALIASKDWQSRVAVSRIFGGIPLLAIVVLLKLSQDEWAWHLVFGFVVGMLMVSVLHWIDPDHMKRTALVQQRSKKVSRASAIMLITAAASLSALLFLRHPLGAATPLIILPLVLASLWSQRTYKEAARQEGLLPLEIHQPLRVRTVPLIASIVFFLLGVVIPTTLSGDLKEVPLMAVAVGLFAVGSVLLVAAFTFTRRTNEARGLKSSEPDHSSL